MASFDIKIETLFRHSPILRSRDLVLAGIPRMMISRSLAAGTIKSLARGVYCRKDYHPSEFIDCALVARRQPSAVICLLTALRIHGLTSQNPSAVWIAIGNKDWAPRVDYPPVRIIRFSEASLRYGTIRKTIDATEVTLTTIEKTIADCFKFRNRIGLDVALEALKDAMRQGTVNHDELWRCAEVDRVTRTILPYLEALS